MLLPQGLDGYATPWTDHDAIIEAPALDPESGDPSEWLSWTDADRFELGAPLTPDEAIPDPPAPTPDPGLAGEETPLEDDTGEFPEVPDPDQGDFEQLAPADEPDQAAKTWDPSPEDFADYLERCELEAGMTARFRA